jgi:hypothetical protein
MIAFAVFQSRHRRKGLAPKAVPFLIAWLLVLFILALFIVAFHFFALPLQHRDWLRSFDEEWDPEKGYWNRYVVTDESIADWLAKHTPQWLGLWNPQKPERLTMEEWMGRK